jgi:methionyl aminopeptidase
MEFLMKTAAANQAKKVQIENETKIPDSFFSSLEPVPSEFPSPTIMKYKKIYSQLPDDQEIRLQELKAALPYYIEGGYIHKQVREWAISNDIIKPGVKLFDMCSQIEEAVRRQTKFHPPDRGLAFPCGCSINSCAAHYSPLPGDNTVLGKSDVMKIDYGVCVGGYIIDSAFSISFDDRFQPLIDASIEATQEGIKYSGPDARLGEIGERIEEVISSYSVEIGGTNFPLKPIRNLGGHQMDRYLIHCGKHIPITKEKSNNIDKMEVGEVYALETFASTGKGFVIDRGATSHFKVNPKCVKEKGNRSDFLGTLITNFSTMAFCQRFIENAGVHQYSNMLNELVKTKSVLSFPPLSDIPGSYVSQHEHSFAILEDKKIIFSK